MSNKRPPVASFAPEEGSEPMTLNRTLSEKTDSVSLPYEVFLRIVEALIEDIFDWEEPVDWDLRYQYDSSSRIFVQENRERYGFFPTNSQMIRWSRSRLPSQINYETRQMVNRVLPRASMLNQDGSVAWIDAWLRPDIDAFIPFYTKSPGLDFNQMCFNAALTYPSSRNAFVHHIEYIRLQGYDWITDVNDDDLAALATLPNLQVIQMEVRRIIYLYMGQPVHFGFRKINYEAFPCLGELVVIWGESFMKKFSPMQDNGVRLYGAMQDWPKIEIRGTKEGIQGRILGANCTCCKPDEGVREVKVQTTDEWEWDWNPSRYLTRRQRYIMDYVGLLLDAEQ
ncbi:hypothetical protein CGCSCA4_v000801 [Colletotrichum siamense]|uniref:Uncharacterized protein n=1 Tax=Colletotrichum siamense TaxID=690259 RepID=A0A9P5F2L0_COLSI|nr:hypothetical protein CGCSCA4_v000801 [Colletotrichum siamense]KAF4866228.1 hypothetical protein CGCSCA2_v000904 [Colletotrichum siamense]